MKSKLSTLVADGTGEETAKTMHRQTSGLSDGSHVASTSGTDNASMISEGESWILTCLNTCC